MLDDDLPAQQEWIAKLRDDHDQDAEWYGYGYFDDVVDVICADPHRQGQRAGYAAGPRAGQEARDGAVGRRAARHGKPRRSPGDPPLAADGPGATGLAERVWTGTRNRAGVAALTAAAVVGTGVSAGMLGVIPLTPPALSPGVTTPASEAAPPVSSVPAAGTTVQHHAAGYVGKHRKLPAVPSSSLTRYGAHSPAAATPASAASPSSAGAPVSGSSQAKSSSPTSGGSQRPPSSSSTRPSSTRPSSAPSSSAPSSSAPSSSAPSSSAPSPSSPPSSSTPHGGTSTGTGTTTSGGGGLVGGLLGGVGGLVGGLL